MTTVIVFDLETVPDLTVARRLLKLGIEVSDDDARQALTEKYGRAFPKQPLHSIACIGALFADRQVDGALVVRSLGARHIGEKSEPDLVRDFLAAIQNDEAGAAPVLVSFNGSGFDLPILRYRALAYGIGAQSVFSKGRRDYWYRYGRDHIDLCDELSGFNASGKPSLDEMAALLGIPGKLEGMDGSQVEEFVRAGRLDDVAAYCLGDVIVTFRLMLRVALVRGEIDPPGLAATEASLDTAIERSLKTWPILSAMRQNASPTAADPSPSVELSKDS